MKNREKFKEVFGVDVKWANVLTPQIEALSSITLKGVSCAGEWLESEYKEQPTANVISIPLDEIKKAREGIDDLDRYFDNDYFSSNSDAMFKCNEVLEILDKLISEGNNTSNS